MRFEYGAERAFADLLCNCWKENFSELVSSIERTVDKTQYAADLVAKCHIVLKH